MRTALSPSSRDPRAADLLRAAFRDVHGPRLHGFAQLLTLGDRDRAASLAAGALAAGTARAADLRHPERAGAWLRARVVSDARRGPPQASPTERRSVLAELGLADAAADALATLSLGERAALVAGGIERFEIGDVATIVGREVADVRRLLRAARSRYLSATTHRMEDRHPPAKGFVALRVEREASGALGARTRDGGEAP